MTKFPPETDPHLHAVQRLFLQHAARLRGFVLGLVPDRHVAEDIFQEVFLTVAAKAHDFEIGSNFLAWARAIARLKVLKLRQEKSSAVLLRPEVLEVIAAAAGDEDEMIETRRAALAECLERLAPRSREIVDLRYGDSPLSPAEIAVKLRWSANAIYVALARARKFLFDCTQSRLGIAGK